MILEEATKEAFGHDPNYLNPKSNKPILTACELCGRFKVSSKRCYYTFCPSCASWASNPRKPLSEKARNRISEANKGKHLSEETKAKISEAHKGKKSYMYGKRSWNKGICCAKGTKRKISEANKGRKAWNKGKLSPIRGDKHPNHGKRGKDAFGWRGGAKLVRAKAKAKHRTLGYIPLNAPFESAEGHHITHNCVVYIPNWLHQDTRHNIWSAKNMQEINNIAFDFLVGGF